MLENKKILLFINLLVLKLVFPIQNNDIILDYEKFTKNKIIEVKKIDINGIGERRRIYFYDNGEIEDISFENDGTFFIEKFKINVKKDIDFLNNISLKAINSVGNDKIEYIQNYKNIELKLGKKDKFEIKGYQEKEYYGNIENTAVFNKEKMNINYTQLVESKELSFLENNVYFYEIKYKDKVFMISNFKDSYEDSEIKKLIEIISKPLFILYNEKEIKKIPLKVSSEKKIIPHVQIEKIKFLDSSHYDYSKYTLLDNREVIKESFEKTEMINQLNLKEERYKLEDDLSNYFEIEFFQDLNKVSKKNLEYSYKKNSLDEITEKKENNSKIFVLYNNEKIENPTIYKIYYNSINPYILITNQDKYIDNIVNKLEKIENSASKEVVNTNKVSQKSNPYNNYIERESNLLPEIFISYEHHETNESYNKNFQDFLYDMFPERRKKINCNDINFNYENLYFLKIKDYALFGNINTLNNISKILKTKYNYIGNTVEEEVKNWYKKYNEVCNYEKLIEKDEIFQNLK